MTRTKPQLEVPSHPELPAEQDNLSHTLIHVGQEIEALSGERANPVAGDLFSEAVLRTRQEERLEELRSIQSAPYFGRVDFRDTQGRSHSVYFGRHDLRMSERPLVLSWRSPVYELYVRGLPGRQGYKNAKGVSQTVEMTLKRLLGLGEGRVGWIQDAFDERPGAVAGRQTSPQESLRRGLKQRRADDSRSIVQTIQAHQYDLIRLPANLALIINGAAGSGKTVIAYHRLAYLLFPERQERLQEHRTVIFAPSDLFLRYLRGLMPELGHRSIAQTTFARWALAQIKDMTPDGLTGEFEAHDQTLERLLDPQLDRSIKNRLWARSRLKGHLHMEGLLRRYANWMAYQITLGEAVYACPLSLRPGGEGNALVLRLTRDRILRAHARAVGEGGPLYAARERLREILMEELVADAREVYSQWGTRWNEGAEERARQEAGRWLGQLMSECWPRVNVQKALETLFTSPELLLGLGQGVFRPAELETLAWQPVRPEEGRLQGAAAFALEDLPAALCLAELMYRPLNQRYDHIVVDEGQDCSPLQYRLLARLSAGGSMTVVGDTAQSIFGYRGVGGWQEVEEALRPWPAQRHEVSVNYRSTRPIVALTNRVLRSRLKEKAVESVAFERDGPEPTIRSLPSREQWLEELSREVRDLRAEHPTVAVIVKLASERDELAQALADRGIPTGETVLEGIEIDQADDAGTGVLVLPASESKGLEFDAVVVADASEHNYSSRVPFDGNLLYVALSRALHRLSVFCLGTPSGYLAVPETGGEPF